MVVQTHQAVTTTFIRDGGATQDGQWWELIRSSIGELFSRVPSSARDVAAVAVTGQWASTVPVDEHGQPTGPCLTWQDRRGGAYVRARIGGPVGGYRPSAIATWIRHTSGAPSLAGADPVGHLLYLEHAVPEQYHRTRWCLEPVDYLTMCFTGSATASHASMQGAWLTDVRASERTATTGCCWTSWASPTRSWRPLRPIGSIIGTVRPALAGPISGSATTSSSSPACPTSSRPPWVPAPPQPVGRTSGPVDHLVDQLPRRRQEDRCPPLDRHRSGAHQRQLPGRQQPGDRGPVARLVALGVRRRRRPATVRGVLQARSLRTARVRRRRLHALVGRRTVARRRPGRSGELHQSVGHHGHPCTGTQRPRGCGLQLAMAPPVGRAVHGTVLAPSGWSVVVPRATCGARSTPTCSTDRWNRSPIPCTPSCAAWR